MNKQQFRAAYREARKADRFYASMRHSAGVKIVSMFDTLDACPGFISTRLHGDPLRWVGGSLIRRDINCHRTLLQCLRLGNTRLP